MLKNMIKIADIDEVFSILGGLREEEGESCTI